MSKKRGHDKAAQDGALIPNLSLSRTARSGERTEDELLLERRK